MSKTPNKTSKNFTPLGIVATFVTLTEASLSLALTQVNGGVQIALTIFVILYAVFVAGCFFVILWKRPQVFYPPSEFGTKDPSLFAKAMLLRTSGEIVEKIQLVENAELKPYDNSAQFQLADALIDEPIRQFLILMHDKNLTLPVSPYNMIPWRIISETNIHSGFGFSGTDLSKKIGGSGLIEPLPDLSGVRLTSWGHEFAIWLTKESKKAKHFYTSLGEWGIPEYPKNFPEKFKQQFDITVPPHKEFTTAETIDSTSDNPIKDSSASRPHNT